MPSQASPGSHWWPRILLLVGALLVTFLLMELGASFWITRLADDEQFQTYASLEQLRGRSEIPTHPFSRYQSHRLIGYVPTPGFQSGADEHNSRGFRGPPIPEAKAEGEFRIVCLGGSTTYTSFVDDDQLAYPAQLERALHEDGYANVRVINGGAAGYSSHESLANLQFRVLDLDPDMIIIYHAVNDVIHRLVWPPSAYQSDDSGFLTHSPGLLQNVPILERSDLIRLLMIQFGLSKSQLSLTRTFGTASQSALWWAFERQVASGHYPSGTFRHVSAQRIFRENPPIYFRRNLVSMIQIAKANEIQPVLATFASRHYALDDGLSAPAIAREIEVHNELIEEVGREQDVPVFDFAADFPPESRLYVGAVHMGPFGAELKGKLFARFLLDSGLVPPPADSGE